MSSNIVNPVSFLRTSREFPSDPDRLTLQINKSWVDIANAVNARMIGIFSVNQPSVTGEEWFIFANQRQQSLRQVFTFSSTSSITHNININSISQFTRCWGQYTDGTNSYGLVWGTSTSTAGLITFFITTTQIIFVLGAGAPALSSGKIVLEWLSSV